MAEEIGLSVDTGKMLEAAFSVGRDGSMAQQVFSRFADEFQHMMGEPFAQDFKDFVKK